MYDPQSKSPETRHRALVVDDHPVFAKSLALVLAGLDSALQISTAYSLASALERLQEFSKNDFVFTDLNLGDASGLEVVKALRERAHGAVIAVVSGRDGVQRMRDAFEIGARAYIPKRLLPDDLVVAVRAVLQTGFWFPQEVADPIGREQRWSVRCRQIVAAIAVGKTNREIGQTLGMSESTVKWHIEEMNRRWGTQGRIGLLAYARRCGVVD
jgi:DNA-binding NarL/FixJ family response regulator